MAKSAAFLIGAVLLIVMMMGLVLLSGVGRHRAFAPPLTPTVQLPV